MPPGLSCGLRGSAPLPACPVPAPFLREVGERQCSLQLLLLFKDSSTVHAHTQSLKNGNYFNYLYDFKNPNECLPRCGDKDSFFLVKITLP